MANRVSVIVPIHNAARTLDKCVHSIVSQRYKNREIILVDDGSTDQSARLCHVFCQENKEIGVIHTPHGGASAARNRGLEHSSGDFVMFVDADDTLEPDAIQNLVDAVLGMNMVIGSFNKVKEGKVTKVSTHTHFRSMKDVAEYVMSNLKDPSRNQLLSGCWAKLYRASTIKAHKISFPEDMRTAEDMAFNFSFLKHSLVVRFIDKVVYNNVKHRSYDSLSMRFDPFNPYGLFDFEDGLEYVEAFLKNHIPENELNSALDNSRTYHTILSFVRLAGQMGTHEAEVKSVMRSLAHAGTKGFQSYQPGRGNYWLIPKLFKWGFTDLAILACQREAKRIYE